MIERRRERIPFSPDCLIASQLRSCFAIVIPHGRNSYFLRWYLTVRLLFLSLSLFLSVWFARWNLTGHFAGDASLSLSLSLYSSLPRHADRIDGWTSGMAGHGNLEGISQAQPASMKFAKLYAGRWSISANSPGAAFRGRNCLFPPFFLSLFPSHAWHTRHTAITARNRRTERRNVRVLPRKTGTTICQISVELLSQSNCSVTVFQFRWTRGFRGGGQARYRARAKLLPTPAGRSSSQMKYQIYKSRRRSETGTSDIEKLASVASGAEAIRAAKRVKSLWPDK